jgi:hypothetical protein
VTSRNLSLSYDGHSPLVAKAAQMKFERSRSKPMPSPQRPQISLRHDASIHGLPSDDSSILPDDADSGLFSLQRSPVSVEVASWRAQQPKTRGAGERSSPPATSLSSPKTFLSAEQLIEKLSSPRERASSTLNSSPLGLRRQLQQIPEPTILGGVWLSHRHKELSLLRLEQLSIFATDIGIPPQRAKDAMDKDNPRKALTSLILEWDTKASFDRKFATSMLVATAGKKWAVTATDAARMRVAEASDSQIGAAAVAAVRAPLTIANEPVVASTAV